MLQPGDDYKTSLNITQLRFREVKFARLTDSILDLSRRPFLTFLFTRTPLPP